MISSVTNYMHRFSQSLADRHVFHTRVIPYEYNKVQHSWSDTLHFSICLLYTSDAADDMQCVDLGGRRIIKKLSYSSWTRASGRS